MWREVLEKMKIITLNLIQGLWRISKKILRRIQQDHYANIAYAYVLRTLKNSSIGLRTSLFIHLSVFIIAIVGLPKWSTKSVELPHITVQLVQEKAPVKTSAPIKKVVKKQQPKPKPKPRPKPQPKLKPKPQAVPKPKPKPKPAPKPKPKQVQQNQSKIVDRSARRPKMDEMDDVLKTISKAQAMQKPKPDPEPKRQPEKVDDYKPFIDSDRARLYTQLKKCWQFPLGAREAEGLVVELDVMVNPDRTVRKTKVVRQPGGAFGRIAVESALRTLEHPACVPLDLPPEKYRDWQNIILEFDPTMMLQ